MQVSTQALQAGKRISRQAGKRINCMKDRSNFVALTIIVITHSREYFRNCAKSCT